MYWRYFIYRVNTFIVKCLFAAVKHATGWPDKQLPAIARQWVMWNLSEATQWLGHRHCGWRHVGCTSGWDTNCHWAVGVTHSIMTASTLATAANRMNTERCVLCDRDTFRRKLVLPSASVSVARPHSGQCWSSLTLRRKTLPHRAD